MCVVVFPRSRWTSGTSRPCRMGCFSARRRPARADSSPARILAQAGIDGPVGRPRAVHGAMVTARLFRIRFTFPAESQLRMNARSPSTTMLTGVLTGVPSRRKVVSRTVRCRAKGANDAADGSRSSAVAGRCCSSRTASITLVLPVESWPTPRSPCWKGDDWSGSFVTFREEDLAIGQPKERKAALVLVGRPGEDALHGIQDGRKAEAADEKRKDTVWRLRSTRLTSTGTTG